MATVQSLADRLRAEIADFGKTFVETFIGDGSTTRYQLSYYPVNGSTLVIKVGTVDVSDTAVIEEHSGVLTLADAPEIGDIVTVAGTYYRYFTDAEICNYVNMAFLQHAGTETNAYGSKVTVANLPAVEEYPVIILASSMALFTLATDASYDINIFAPDGVTIPRSERYQQLMEMVQARREQYKELCSLLGVGLYRIEVSTLRKISPRTNRYVPVYLPQELDDSSLPKRLHVPLPTYMDQTKSVIENYDIELYQGDSFSVDLDFPFSLVGYNLLAQIRAYSGAALIIDTFTFDITDAAAGKVTMSLTSQQVEKLPMRAIWDLQITSDSDANYQHTYLKGSVLTEREVTTTNRNPFASGWQG